MRGWLKRVSANLSFKFTAKLFRGFTHDRNATPQDEVVVEEGSDAFAGANRPGALLLQFPWSFKFATHNPNNI